MRSSQPVFLGEVNASHAWFLQDLLTFATEPRTAFASVAQYEAWVQTRNELIAHVELMVAKAERKAPQPESNSPSIDRSRWRGWRERSAS